MSPEMRRPGVVAIDSFVAALDAQLGWELWRLERRAWPMSLHRVIRALRAVAQPILQTGAIVVTSAAVIVAVGVAPASMPSPPAQPTLALPTDFVATVSTEADPLDALPPGELLVAAAGSGMGQAAAKPDTPRTFRE